MGTVQRQSALLGGCCSSWSAEGLNEVRGGMGKGRGRFERGFDMMRDGERRRILEESRDCLWTLVLMEGMGGEEMWGEGGSCGFNRGIWRGLSREVTTCGPTRGDSLRVQADESLTVPSLKSMPTFSLSSRPGNESLY